MSRRQNQQGFALIVIAGLFMAFAMVAAAMIDRSNATQQRDQYEQTQAQLSRISTALIKYYLFNNNRYPCPAETNVAAGAAGFGNPVTNCGLNSSPTNGATLTTLTVTPPYGGAMVRGMVPITALAPYGIDPNDAFDVWGDRIMYVVDRYMTTESTSAYSALTSRATVSEINSGISFVPPDFLVISYGKDRLGGIPRQGTAPACPAGIDPRAENCNSTAAFKLGPINAAPGTDAAHYFDDALSFYTSPSIFSCTDTGSPVNWGASNECTADFPTLPEGATSELIASTAAGTAGAAQVSCSYGAPLTLVAGSESCAATCTPANDTVYTRKGIIPGVCPDAVTLSQTSTYNAGQTRWEWQKYTYHPDNVTLHADDPTHYPACTSVLDHDTNPPEPYRNTCGELNVNPRP